MYPIIIAQTLWRGIWSYLAKLHKCLCLYSARLLLGIYPQDTNKNYKVTYCKTIHQHMVYNSERLEIHIPSSQGLD